MPSRRALALAFALALLLFLTSCGSVTEVAQPQFDPQLPWTLAGAHSIGQTLVAYHDGLNGIEVALSPTAGGDLPPLTFSLRPDPLDPEQLREGMGVTGTLTSDGPGQSGRDGWARLAFSPLYDSRNRRFYLEVAWSGGAVTVPFGPAGAYRSGAAYLDGQAQEAQLAFRLTYDSGAMALGMLQNVIAGLPQAMAASLLFLLPGLALTSWLLQPGSTGPASRLALSAGLSVALFPLILLAARTTGWPNLGPAAVWLILAICGASLLPKAWRGLRAGNLRQRLREYWSWPSAVLVFVVGVVFAVRLIVVGGLAAPMWGDSYEHAVIAQLLADHGGLFDSWQPYAPFDTFTIHYGLHAAIAFFQWVTGFDTVQSVIITAQILNGLAVVALYPLAVRLSQSSRSSPSGDPLGEGRLWTGIAVVVIAGLLSPMPMFYVNWGRYAQLASQVVLPVALWFLCDALEAPRRQIGRLALAAVALAGLVLCHYRAILFYITFVLCWWPLTQIPFPAYRAGTFGGHSWYSWRIQGRRWLDSAVRLGAVGLGAVVLILPQVLHVSQGYLLPAIDQAAAQPISWAAIVEDYEIWHQLTWYVPLPLLVMATMGLAWSLIRRQWAMVAVGLWAALLFMLKSATLLRIPGLGLLTSFAVIIAWYMPISLLGAEFVGNLAHWLIGWRPRLGQMVVIGGLLLVSLWGARQQMAVIDPYHEIVTHADRAAMDWIAEYIPTDALFAVNGFSVYDDTSVVGADGGWWIPLLAHRQTTMPPQYALLNEMPSEPGYLQRITSMVLDLQAAPATSPEGQQVLCENGITHIYIGQGQGLVGSSRPALFSAADLAASPAFEPLYHQDRVWIFAFDRSVCVNAR